MALSQTTSYGFLTPCQNSEKTHDAIPRKRQDRRTEGQKDGQTLCHRIIPATAGVPKRNQIIRFSFEQVALSNVVKAIKDINRNKSSTKGSITPKMLKINSETTAKILQKLFNESLETGTSPDSLKLPEITPIFKKGDPLNISQLVFSLLCQNYLKRLCRNN